MFRWADVCGQRPAVMGILNVTPDSFSDGGGFLDAQVAVEHGLAMVSAGAGILDVGGESTRPGATPVAVDEELRRVVPVVAELSARSAVVVSVDTTKAEVAEAALAAGARVVNDVSAGADPTMFETIARADAGCVVMHMRGTPSTMQDDPRYDDVVREVGDYLAARLDTARAAGIPDAALAADPGLGFGKTVAHNLELLAGLRELAARVGVPLVVGPSRKRFIGVVLQNAGGELGEPEPAQRDDGTLATAVWAADHGAAVVRVHDVRSVSRALELLDALERCTADVAS